MQLDRKPDRIGIGKISVPWIQRTLPKFSRQIARKNFQQAFPVLCTPGAALLEFDNVPSNLPACAHPHRIDTAQNLLTGLLNQTMQASQQGWQAGIIFCFCTRLLGYQIYLCDAILAGQTEPACILFNSTIMAHHIIPIPWPMDGAWISRAEVFETSALSCGLPQGRS